MNILIGFNTSVFNLRPEDLGSNSIPNSIAMTFALLFIAERSVAIFSMLFGVSLAMQFDRLQENTPRVLIARRLVILLLFGFVHVTLLWHGDILVQYAVAGLLVLPLLRLPTRVQVILIGLLFAFSTAPQWLPPPWSAPTPEIFGRYSDAAKKAFQSDSFYSVVRFNIEVLPIIVALHLSLLARTIGLCLIGVVAWRVYEWHLLTI